VKAAIRRAAFIHWVPIALFLVPITVVASGTGNGVELNQIASMFAKELIKQGEVVADGKGAWTEHRPSVVQENEFIRIHGFGEYAKWHLGIDRRFSETSKRRYKFPYGDFKNVHRCGLLAAKARARQYGDTDIREAAAELIRAMKTKPKGLTDFGDVAANCFIASTSICPRAQKRIDQFR
jgi:hypothetical protein